MEKIQQKAIETYQKNLSFLEQNDSELYQRVQALSMMIELGEYSERYHLEYIQEDNTFDLLDTKTQTHVYNKQASKFNQDALRNTNLDKLNSIDLFQNGFYNIPHKVNIGDDLTLTQKDAANVSNDLSEYTSVFNYSTLDPNKKFKKIEKFIFVGTLLGTHIEAIHEKLRSIIYFITETNLEIFRLSLFTCPYFKIAQESKIIFSIMEDDQLFYRKFNLYFISNFKANYMIKYYSTNYNIQNSFEKIISAASNYNTFIFTYHKFLSQLIKPTLQNISKYPVFHSKQQHTILQNKPVILIAAGPSLAKNIEWLKKCREKFIVVSIGAAVKKLIKHDIYPDIITSADSGEVVHDHFPPEIQDKIKNTIFLASNITMEDILLYFNPENIFLYEVMTTLKETSKHIDGASIGEVTLHLLLIMGANQIYLLGTDLALDQETGSTHISDHQFSNNFDIGSKDENSFMREENYSNKNTLINVKGNFRDSVVTTTVFQRSLVTYNEITNEYKDKNIQIHNLNDGAYIQNTIPTKAEDILVEKLSSMDKLDLNSFFSNHSSKNLSENDLSLLRESLNFMDTLENNLTKLKKLKVKSYDGFLELRKEVLTTLTSDVSKFYRLVLSDIFQNYLSVTEPYLAYHFNDKNLENETQKVKKVKDFWINQILSIIDIYRSLLQENFPQFENDLTIKKKTNEIKGFDDLELEIKRKNSLTYHLAYKDLDTAEGIIFIVPGFGGDNNLEYQKNLLAFAAREHNLLAVFVEYHGIFNRLENGAELTFDEFDKNILSQALNKYNIDIDLSEKNFFTYANLIDKKITLLKNSNELNKNHIEYLTATLLPAKGEYQNFGLLQVIDILTVVSDLAQSKEFGKLFNSVPLISLGSSHGGYISLLAGKLIPNLFDVIIENSSYVTPPLKYILGKKYSTDEAELSIQFDFQNILVNAYTFNHWDTDKTSKYYFNNDAFTIRNLLNQEQWKSFLSHDNITTQYISYHSKHDKIAPLSEKKKLHEFFKENNISSKLIEIDSSDIDGKFIKNTDHGMNMSIKSLMNKTIPDILKNYTALNKQRLLNELFIRYSSKKSEYICEFKDKNFFTSFKKI